MIRIVTDTPSYSQPRPPKTGAADVVATLTRIKRDSARRRLGPSLLDPVGRGGRLVVPFAGLGPIRRRGDVANRNGDDPVGVPGRERVIRQVLAESGHRVLIALVIVGPDVDVARRSIHAEAFELADDRLVLRPAAGELVGALDGGLEHVERDIGAFRLEVRIFVPTLVVALDERLIQRPTVAARIGEVVIGVDAREHALGVILADGVRRDAHGERGRDLHLVDQAVAQRLFVEGHVIAAPDRAVKQVRLRRYDLGDVRREVGGAELRPAFRYDLSAGQQAFNRQGEVLGRVAAVAVVGVDVGDLAHVRPGL